MTSGDFEIKNKLVKSLLYFFTTVLLIISKIRCSDVVLIRYHHQLQQHFVEFECH